jgi:multiple sugar transport system substrate-binding protein
MTIKYQANQITGGPMISRRDLIKGASAGLVLAALGTPYIAKAKPKANLKFSMWGDTGSTPAYKHVVEKYQAANPGVQVDIQVIPYGQYYQQLDTSITGGQPADLMRFEYQTVGRYAQSSVLLNLSEHLDKNIADDYLPAFWQPVHSAKGLFAIPQNTDTFGIFYNKSIFQAAGIVPPTDIAKSWTWAEFTDVAQKILRLKKTPFAFAMDWGLGSAYRSLVFFYQHNAHLLSQDQKSTLMDSKEAVETIAWLQSWFQKGMVPPNTSVKSQEQPNILFANNTLAMYVGGDWEMADLVQNIGDRFEWGTTFMPRDVNLASDLGGSCVGVSKSSQYADEAVDFLKFLTSPDVQKVFLAESQFLPVRKSIANAIVYKDRPEDRKVFIEQAATVPPELSRNYALPYFAKLNTVLNDQFDLAFTANQDPSLTGQNIVSGISGILKAYA